MYCNILTPEGFTNAIILLLKAKPGNGGVHFGIVCSSWVYINRGTSLRTKTRPLGDSRESSVNMANEMVSRSCLLILLATALGLVWTVEQPVTSLMQYHPRFQLLFKLMKDTMRKPIYRLLVKMGDFGAATEKACWIYTNKKWMASIINFKLRVKKKVRTTQVVQVYQDKKGQTKIMGGKDMKKSQVYPMQFGKAMARTFNIYRESLQKEFLEFKARVDKAFMHSDEHHKETAEDPWADANLMPVFRHLLGRGG